MIHQFPFGQPLKALQQTDRTPKRVFILGVYPSPVHARWLDLSGTELVRALPIATEPYLFWKGEGANDIIKQIPIPPEAGTLELAAEQFNGAVGQTLDDRFLSPLGLERKDAWLCNLIPHPCLNSGQQKAIIENYLPYAQAYSLPPATIPLAPDEELTTGQRRNEIVDELRESQAPTVITLGDQPIRWFFNKVGQPFKRLADLQPYGRLHSIRLGGMKLHLLPLVHPRQAAKLGISSEQWFQTHDQWIQSNPATLLS